MCAVTARCMDSAVKYLVAGSVFSLATSALWCLWVRFERSIHSCIFVLVARRFSLSYHRLHNASIIVTVSRILDQLDLKTNTYLWQHEVNIDSDDSIMTGYIRLPASTWFMWLLALLGISHYIYISDDANEMVIAGPTDFVFALLRLSSTCSNCAVSADELNSLSALLCVRSCRNSAEWKCRLCERCILLMLQCSALVLTGLTFKSGYVLAFLGMSILWFAYTWCRDWISESVVMVASGESVFSESGSESELNESLFESVQPAEHVVLVTKAPDVQWSGPDADVDFTHYSVLVSRLTWFEVSFRRPLAITTEQFSLVLRSGSPVSNVYAIPLHVGMLHHVAAHVDTDCVLYMCIHNPMVDCPFIEMQELVKKATRAVALVVLLPPLEELDAALSASSPLRVHSQKETKYVATYCDWAAWLMLVSSGVFAHIALVLPHSTSEYLSQSQAWACAQRIAVARVIP